MNISPLHRRRNLHAAVLAVAWLTGPAGLCGLLGLSHSPSTLLAAGGTEIRRQSEDLDITVDSRWAGCGSGGYYPVRISALNKAKDREVTFRVLVGEQPSVTKRVTLRMNARTEFTLLIPMVAAQGVGGRLQVESGGRQVRSMEYAVPLPDHSVDTAQPSLLAISSDKIDFDEYDMAINSTYQALSTSSSYRSGVYSSAIAIDSETDRMRLNGLLLPKTWLAYSGLDMVAIPLAKLRALGSEQHDALLGWVETGGTLLVTEVGGPAPRSRELRETLGLDKRAGVSEDWESADTNLRRMISYIQTSDEEAASAGGPTVALAPPALKAGGAKPAKQVAGFGWPATGSAFASRRIQQGLVVGFPGDPFLGTRHDWRWFFNSLAQEPLGSQRLRWQIRQGMASRATHREFLSFTIPGVDSVPVVAFLVLITVFSIVIGPMNYVFLRRRRKLYLLVVTVPVIAVITSGSLLGYALFSHGFGVKSRTRSLTLLDQRNETAVTTARVALFAGMAPSTLNFNRDTAVYPVWASGVSFSGGSVDWTNQQSLSGGWIKTRTRAQFVTVYRRAERGRLTVGSVVNGMLSVDNGLEWDLEWLLVCDAQGKLYVQKKVPAGRSAKLASVFNGDKVLQDLTTRVNRLPPSGVKSYGDSMSSGEYYSPHDTGPVEANTTFSSSMWDMRLRTIGSGGRITTMPNNSYLAVIDGDPDIQRGCRTSEKWSLHILMGRY